MFKLLSTDKNFKFTAFSSFCLSVLKWSCFRPQLADMFIKSLHCYIFDFQQLTAMVCLKIFRSILYSLFFTITFFITNVVPIVSLLENFIATFCFLKLHSCRLLRTKIYQMFVVSSLAYPSCSLNCLIFLKCYCFGWQNTKFW